MPLFSGDSMPLFSGDSMPLFSGDAMPLFSGLCTQIKCQRPGKKTSWTGLNPLSPNRTRQYSSLHGLTLQKRVQTNLICGALNQIPCLHMDNAGEVVYTSTRSTTASAFHAKNACLNLVV